MITKIWYSFKILVFTFWNKEILLNLLHINLSAVYVWNSLRDVVMEPSHSLPFWAHTGARLSLGLFSCARDRHFEKGTFSIQAQVSKLSKLVLGPGLSLQGLTHHYKRWVHKTEGGKKLFYAFKNSSNMYLGAQSNQKLATFSLQEIYTYALCTFFKKKARMLKNLFKLCFSFISDVRLGSLCCRRIWTFSSRRRQCWWNGWNGRNVSLIWFLV